MADLFRVLSAPVQPAGGAPVDELAALVVADAMCRWARHRGYTVQWVPAVVSSDLTGQHETERELARTGLDRSSLAREEFIERVRGHEETERARLAGVLASLRVEADVEAGVIDRAEVAVAARTAFVRLFEEGRIVHDERIVRTCGRCGTVVDHADAEPAELPVDAAVVDVGCENGEHIRIRLTTPELLPGAVALVVPEGHPGAGSAVVLPLVPSPLPVVAGEVDEPALLVPFHDGADLTAARRLGLAPIEVLDVGGHVVAPGPLDGLARFAAREAAVAHLDSEGVLAGREPAVEDGARCRRCSSILVSRLGRHWFLDVADLEVAAADAVRQGDVAVSPSTAREEFLARAGEGGDWCLSHQVWTGLSVPVARCLDCGKLNVAVELGGTCGTCMGTLEPDDSVLDARFVASVAPLAEAGWPGDQSAAAGLAPSSTFVAPSDALAAWALPIAALGLRLSGSVPFARLAVHDDPELADGDALDALVSSTGAAAARAVLAGGLGCEDAAAFVASVADPPPGDADLDMVEVEVDEAIAGGLVGTAATALASAARLGVGPAEGARLRRLCEPVLGE